MSSTRSLKRFAPRAAAVVAALGLIGAGTATGASLITGKQIKNRSVAGIDIKKKSLGVGHLTPKARTSLRGATGPAGAAGAAGAKGDTGAQGIQGVQGERGPSDAYFTNAAVTSAPDAMTTVDTLDLPAGNYVIEATISGESLAGTDKTLECQLVNGATVLEEVEDYYATAVGKSNMTISTVAALDGFQVNSNDVELQCADNGTAILIDTQMTAIKVATLTAA
jgi:hypothetical protein